MITSNIEKLENEGEKLSVGFRPSGELHLGNLLSIAYGAVLADKLGLELDLFCCDTDWSAHIHQDHRPENSDLMRLFFKRSCPCGNHENIAEHRVEEIRPFLEGLEKVVGSDIEVKYLSDLAGDTEYMDALSQVLSSIDELDSVFGGGFRRRYRSPVVNVCSSCGFSHSKGSSYSEDTRELVSACRNPECSKGFANSKISEEIGVYYLVDPVRDPGRDVAVHVFGGDYKNAEKEMKTTKIEKVEKITQIACGEAPDYFIAPLIADQDGKPLSKSKGTGKTVSQIDNLEKYGTDMAEKVESLIGSEKGFMSQKELTQL